MHDKRNIEAMSNSEETKFEQLQIDADLLEATPSANGLWHWILASPLLLFIAWNWIAIADTLSPIPWMWVNIVLSGIAFIALLVLPLGNLGFLVVSMFPRIFQHAGWELQPRETYEIERMYSAKYTYLKRARATTNWSRIFLRAAQGWVYLEIFVIFAGAILMIPLFWSASQFGFGS